MTTILKSAQFLRGLRLKNNISDLKAAYRLNVSLEKYIDIESAPHKLSLQDLEELLKALECNIEEFNKFQALVLMDQKQVFRQMAKEFDVGIKKV